jgi:hypothetical protein
MNEKSTIDTAALLAASPHKATEHLEADDPKLVPFLAYTDRESYLAWVAAWKAEYKSLSATIRTEKREWRAAGSNIPWQLQFSLPNHKRLARTLLALRHAGKADSWARAQAAKAALVAVAV